MTKNICALLSGMVCILFAGKSIAHEPNCATNELFKGLMFELSVQNSLDSDLEFRFCVGENESFLVSELNQTAFVSQHAIIPSVKYQSKVKLTAEIKTKIDDLYQDVLLRSRPDNIRGKDGSYWCFRPKSGLSYSELCYWSPNTTDSPDRDVKAIASLGEYLLGLSGLQAFGGLLQ